MSHHIAELVNRPLNPQAPYVGSSAFAHKAGLHVSAIAKRKDAYEHVDPESVGNGTRFVVSEMAGRATIKLKAEEIGLAMDGAAVNQVIDDLKRLEHEGYHFEAADASLELLMRRAGGWEQEFFRVESMRVITDELPSGDFTTEATVKVWVPGGEGRPDAERYVHTAEGNGPVNAIDTALRAAVGVRYPRARPRPPDRLQGPHPRRGHGHGCGHPRADRRLRRRALVDDDRGLAEHHRGVVAGARRFDRLRPAARRPPRPRPSRTGAWPRPRSCPVSPVDKPRTYESPDHVPEAWRADRPADLAGRQPAGAQLGYQGPDQGYGLLLAERFRDRLQLQQAEAADDAIQGSLGVALRRASMFGRAPTIHDFTVAFTIWGFLDPAPPADLVARRRPLFEGVRHVSHHYAEARAIADGVPQATLRKTHQQVVSEYPTRVAGAARRLTARRVDVAVVGGGIAGVSAACELAETGRSVVLLEQEEQLAHHTTGRSAAIFLESYGPPAVRALTVASRADYDAAPERFGTPRLLEPRSALWIAPPSQLADLARLVAEVPTLQTIAPSDAVDRCPRAAPRPAGRRGDRARRVGHRRPGPPPGLRPGPGRGRGDGRPLGPRHRAGASVGDGWQRPLGRRRADRDGGGAGRGRVG